MTRSFSELTRALKDELAAQTASLRDALTGLLPSSTLGGLGIFAGATQKPIERESQREGTDAG